MGVDITRDQQRDQSCEQQLDALVAQLGAAVVVRDPDVIAGYLHDEAEWAPFGAALAVARVRTSGEAQAVVRWALQHHVPVVARGSGTGLSGGANAVDGCIIVSFEKMTAIREINALERIAVVEPGVVNDDLRAAVAEQGLWYPPDPASSPWSTIGGNVATNAGGMCCVKYGVTRDYVIGLELVTGTGELVRVGRRTAKGVSGLDLVGLMVGSEGTLALVTEITVKLRPPPAASRTVVGYFDSIVNAGNAVRDVAARGLTPSALELVDQECLRAVDEYAHMGLAADANVMLIGVTDEPGAAGEASAQGLLAAFASAGASFTAGAEDQQEAAAMMAARRLAYPALERLGDTLTEDVCVPKEHVPEMLRRIEAAAAEFDTRIASIAHAGDGNLHPLLLTPPGDTAAKARAQQAFTRIIEDALELGGTVTGEHGVGLLKAEGMVAELGPEVVGMQRAIKKALDPAGIFNPGKAIG